MTNDQPDEFLPPFSRPRFAAITAAAIVAVLAGFTAFPILDQAVSRFFYMPGPVSWENSAWYCRGYALACHPVLAQLRGVFQLLPIIAAVAILLALAWSLWTFRSVFNRQVLRNSVAFWSLLIGNFVIVDFVLKEHWGRPRPYHPFIGEPRFDSYVFVAAGDWRGACLSNCSFVSGEASALFWMVCATVLLPRRIFKPAFIAALAAAIAGSSLRVAFGAHYPSDVIVGGLLSVLVFSLAAVCASLIERKFRALPLTSEN